MMEGKSKLMPSKTLNAMKIPEISLTAEDDNCVRELNKQRYREIKQILDKPELNMVTKEQIKNSDFIRKAKNEYFTLMDVVSKNQDTKSMINDIMDRKRNNSRREAKRSKI